MRKKEKAIDLLRKRAEQGDAQAQFDLGWEYFNGEGVLKNDKEAFKWFRKAAEQGNVKGQHGLGMMYALGQGVLKDCVAAYAWLGLAIYNHYPSEKYRDLIAKEMTPGQIAKAQELSKELLKQIEANIEAKKAKQQK